MKEIATQIKAQLLEIGIEIQLSEIEVKLGLFINKFRVQSDEARRNVINFFVKDNTNKPIEYPENWKYLKQMIYKNANYKCQYCGKSGFGLNAHHLIHLSKGGSNNLENLVCVCDECHSIIHPKNKKLIDKHCNTLNKNFY